MRESESPEFAASERHQDLKFWRTPLQTLLEEELPSFTEEEVEWFKSQIVVAEDLMNDTSIIAQNRKWDRYPKEQIVEENYYKYLIYEVKKIRKNNVKLDPQGLTPTKSISRTPGGDKK